MSQFKFNQPERHNAERLLQQVRHMGLSVIEGVDRIEQIISARGESDGWVTDDELDREFPSTIAQMGRRLTDEESQEGIFFDNFYKKEGAKWMRSKLFPSPPKPDQQ